MQKLVVGLFVGRFQPGLHFGEFDGIQQAIEKGVTHFVIAIGSSNKEFTKENPFTYDERKVMIDLSFSHVS
jgi:nicotinamide mononucleotide adenylyltransferase